MSKYDPETNTILTLHSISDDGIFWQEIFLSEEEVNEYKKFGFYVK